MEYPSQPTAQRATKSYLVFLLLTLNRLHNQESRIRKKWKESNNDHELQQRQVVNPFSQF